MRRLAVPALAGALAVAAAVPALAVSPRYWIHDTAEEMLAGETDGVSILGEGTLRLAPRLDVLAEPEVPYVWDVVAADDGRVYVGTGDDGWVLEVRGGKARDFFQCAAYEVLSVALGPDGTVYAGTAPEGFVYRIAPDGEGTVLFDAEESYVWDLAFGPDGKLYAAVGTKGAVYRIDPSSGRADRVFSTDDNHVVCLAFDGADLIAGTEGRGLVVRIAPDGSARVLHDCPQGEVGAVLPGADGVVWAAAAATSEAREDARTESSDQADGNGDAPEDDFEDNPFFFDVSPVGAGDGVLYRIDAEGNAFRVWESGHGGIFDLAAGPDGTVLAVTGEGGAVYTVEADGSATLVLDAEEDQIVSVAETGDGWVLGTANPSRVYRLDRKPRKEGTYTSEVLDAQRVARWGRIEWTGEKGGGDVRLSVRSGNTDKPDDTWTPWKETAAGGSAPADVPPARFLQWRARLSGGGNDGPRVRRVRVSSLENNVPPVISGVEVLPSGTRFYDDVPELRPRALYQALPGGVNVQYQFDQGGDPEYPPEYRAPWTQGLRQVQWDALDPNGDVLTYDLAYRREDEERWKMFAEDVDGKLYTFNGNGVPDGEYRLRVTASDRLGNPAAPAEASAVSEVFVVDNTAPDFEEMKHDRDGDEVRITGHVRDALSDVIRLEHSVDGGDWVDSAPADGIFDSPRERIDLTVTAAPGEEHSVLLRGTDQAGNLGAVRILLRP